MTIRRFTIACALLLFARYDPALGAEVRLALSPKLNLSPGALYSEDSVNFYGTHVYLLESSMLRKRAEQAFGHPVPAGLKITAERVPNTSIILVSATGADEAAAASFVASLVDEFLKYKREQKKRQFAEAIARVDAALKAASQDATADLQKVKQQLTVASVLETEPDFEKLPDK